MPKRIPVEAKRVPLNCLVLPETLEYLKSSIASQGMVVDMAVAALRAQEAQGRVILPPVLDGLANQGRGNQNPDEPFAKVVSKELKRQTWKRGPRPKGDKTR